MTAKRRNKLRKLAEEIPVPEVYGDQEGDTLLVGWGSTYGPIHDAVKLAREHGEKIGAHAFAPRPSVAERPGKNLREIQAHRRRRDERPGPLRFRPARHDSARPLLRPENRKRHQDRRSHLPREGNSSKAFSPANLSRPGAIHANRPVSGNGEQDVEVARGESIAARSRMMISKEIKKAGKAMQRFGRS